MTDAETCPGSSRRKQGLLGFLKAPCGAFFYWSGDMETRVAIIGIIVEKQDSVDKLNTILHDYAEVIIGRMGLPYRKKNISIISLAVDAPQEVISALSGKLGRLDGVAVKTAYSSI
jgi:putative iron-only hydrogenase system regulator